MDQGISKRNGLSKSGRCCVGKAFGISEERSLEVNTGLADGFVVAMMEG